MANKGLLVVVSGPSGTGKGTVIKALLAAYPTVRLSVSATTRAPRPGETNGKEYYFIGREKFDEMVRLGEMLENAEYCGNRYGTPCAPIDGWISQGLDAILEIEVQGGAQVKEKRPDSVGIFVLPPSFQELERRLRNRGTEPEEVIQKRLAAAHREIREASRYDYVVVNDTVEGAAERIHEIINVEKRRSHRNAQRIERMLKDD